MFTTAPPMPQFLPSSPCAPLRSSPLSPQRNLNNNTYSCPSPSTPTRTVTMNPGSSPATTTTSSLFNFTPTTTPSQTPRGAPTTGPTSTATPPTASSSSSTAAAATTPASQFTFSFAKSSPSATGTSTYAQRYASTISNPMKNAAPRSYTASSSPSARTARRNLFLSRVKQDRDAGRFDSRGEQLVLMEDAAEQKKWGEAMRRRAGLLGFDEEEDEVDMDGAWVEADARALDEYLEQERVMEMQMVENATSGPEAGGSFSDEEYDGIFMDLAGPDAVGQDMDMSG